MEYFWIFANPLAASMLVVEFKFPEDTQIQLHQVSRKTSKNRSNFT